MTTRTPRILILIDMPVARNPVMMMYVRALSDTYSITVACQDPVESLEKYPHISFSHLWYESSLAARIDQVTTAQGQDQTFSEDSQHQKGEWEGPLAGLRIVKSFAGAAARIVKCLRNLPRPDCIIAIDGDVLPAARLLSILWGVPYIYHVYEIWPNQFFWRSPLRSRIMARIERWGIRGSTVNIVPELRWAKLVRRRHNLPDRKFAVVHPCPRVPPVRSADSAGNPLKVYYHGGYTRGRGLENLISAMANVDGAHLYLRGVGGLESELRSMAREMPDRVTLLEPVSVESLVDAATEFDVGIVIACPNSANHRMLTGFKFFENLAAGLAIACSGSRVLGPLVRQHGIGITFKGCCTESISDALNYCVRNSSKVAEWKRASRSLADAHMNAKVQDEQLRQTMGSVLK